MIRNYVIWIISGLLVCGVLIALNEARITQKLRADRLEINQRTLLDETIQQKEIIMSAKEFKDLQSKVIVKLLDSLKIKPRQVTRYTERLLIDTVSVPVIHYITDSIKRGVYPYIDISGCFRFQGNIIIGDSLVLQVVERQYINRSEEIAYIKRSHKFLFIRYGKFEGKLFVNSECGTETVKDIKVIKNGN